MTAHETTKIIDSIISIRNTIDMLDNIGLNTEPDNEKQTVGSELYGTMDRLLDLVTKNFVYIESDRVYNIISECGHNSEACYLILARIAWPEKYPS